MAFWTLMNLLSGLFSEPYKCSVILHYITYRKSMNRTPLPTQARHWSDSISFQKQRTEYRKRETEDPNNGQGKDRYDSGKIRDDLRGPTSASGQRGHDSGRHGWRNDKTEPARAHRVDARRSEKNRSGSGQPLRPNGGFLRWGRTHNEHGQNQTLRLEVSAPGPVSVQIGKSRKVSLTVVCRQHLHCHSGCIPDVSTADQRAEVAFGSCAGPELVD